MVQSIWLKFDELEHNHNKDSIIQTIKEIVKKSYKTYSCYERSSTTLFKFYFIDCNQIKEISTKLGITLDDTTICPCGCMSTDLEILSHFIQLELKHGLITEVIPELVYFDLGQNLWGNVGMFHERLNIIRYILEDIQQQLKEHGIKSTIDLEDCDNDFVNYFNPEEIE